MKCTDVDGDGSGLNRGGPERGKPEQQSHQGDCIQEALCDSRVRSLRSTDDLTSRCTRRSRVQRPLLVKGGRNGADHGSRGSRQGARRAAARVAHQVHHQGAAGPVRVRRCEPPARLAARATPRVHEFFQLHRSRACRMQVHLREAGGAASSTRSTSGQSSFPTICARARPHGVFFVYETASRQGGAAGRSCFITSNNEKESRRLPAPLLLPYIASPTRRRWKRISGIVHFPPEKGVLREALEVFFECARAGLKKSHRTSELLDWLKLLARPRTSRPRRALEGPQDHHPAAARRRC